VANGPNIFQMLLVVIVRGFLRATTAEPYRHHQSLQVALPELVLLSRLCVQKEELAAFTRAVQVPNRRLARVDGRRVRCCQTSVSTI